MLYSDIDGAHSVKSFDTLSRDTGSFFKYVNQLTHCQTTDVESERGPAQAPNQQEHKFVNNS